MFFLENSKPNSQTTNPFLYNTFLLDRNKAVRRCYLKVNNEVYPTIPYSLPRDESRLYQKRLSSSKNLQSVSLLNRNNFKDLFSFIYFDLSALKDKQTELSFHCELNNETTTDYTIYAIIWDEKLYNLKINDNLF